MFKKRKNNKLLKEYIDTEYQKVYELVENELDQKETLSYEEFQYIIVSIYEILKKTINKEETYKVITHYLELVKACSLIDNTNVDKDYFTNRIDYLAFYYDKKLIKKYEKNIDTIKRIILAKEQNKPKKKTKVIFSKFTY